jgi:hypothetical protein
MRLPVFGSLDGISIPLQAKGTGGAWCPFLPLPLIENDYQRQAAQEAR